MMMMKKKIEKQKEKDDRWGNKIDIDNNFDLIYLLLHFYC
jgi:hypothetical protein